MLSELFLSIGKNYKWYFKLYTALNTLLFFIYLIIGLTLKDAIVKLFLYQIIDTIFISICYIYYLNRTPFSLL